ncbi:type VI secretion system tip protein VgrG [Sphingomonas gilva]|uniref:Type VI secretion system tip protein VgrG n=1 Tax=Sphingomonas gilva TaxID=2305907 RepID=A0A396RL63_9SPHN|nr:type VI secretion system tip protein TssI/VgrG [Sphingomonas gilva]RHW17010.1 type VI secretion system tip protein VgrG [Sphingomonas gilva]
MAPGLGVTTDRQTTMVVDLGDEQVVLERVVIREALSEPFEISVDILSEHGELDLRPHLGKVIKVKVEQGGEIVRRVHGYIIEGMFVGEAKAGWRYRLTVRPWTYFMDANLEYRIFQEKNAKQILEDIFRLAGQPDVDFSKLTSKRIKRTYCVQYGESDFDFASRIMEEEGIYYYFVHEDNRHQMVLCEGPGSHAKGAPDMLTYNAYSQSMVGALADNETATPFVTLWMERLRTAARGKVTMRDWDFRRPQKPINRAAERSGNPCDKAEVYMGASRVVLGEPMESETLADANTLSALYASRVDQATYTGMSQSLGLTAGFKVKIDHENDRFDDDYLITSTQHTIVSETYRSGDSMDAAHGLDVAFEAIPAATPFRPQQRTPRPVVRGLESAIVTGPPGEVIYTDEYGRVKVQFHWDRLGKKDDKTSCWIRVSQTGGLGNLILPRVGHEVLIDFLGGDPDRPIVVGRVFNAEHMPLYKLPDHRTIATWRSKTVGQPAAIGEAKAVGDDHPGIRDKPAVESNELRFEDKAGQEEVYLHANRLLNVRVRMDETHKVGQDQTIFVGRNRTEKVEKDEKVEILGKRDYTLTGNETEIISEGNRTTTIKKGNRTATLEMGNDALNVKMGNITVKAAMGKIEMEAMQSIELKVGQNSIKIDQMGVTIKGMMVKSEAQTMNEVKGAMTTTQGSAMMTVKGAITMIN